MAVTIYNDGSLYGDADAIYGRIDPTLLAAQQASFRQTGLRVQVTDEKLNQWSRIVEADPDQRPNKYRKPGGPGDVNGYPAYDQRYYTFRAQTDACKLGNGNIIRVRVDVDTRNVMIQTITDPTIFSQWESWSTLYTGEHFGIAIAPDTSSTYIVYTTKIDGLYRNNTKVWDHTNLVSIRMHKLSTGENEKEVLWVAASEQGYRTRDVFSGFVAERRDIQWFFTTNANGGAFNAAQFNFGWRNSSVGSITRDDGKFARITAYPYYFEPGQTPVSLLSDIFDVKADLYKVLDGSRLIRGMSTAAQRANISAGEICRLEDGYYYLFYRETHRGDTDPEDRGLENISNLSTPLVWQRSKDCETWSEPVHLGTYAFGLSAVVEDDTYVYLLDRTAVIRRPKVADVYDISNYVPGLTWDSPRENQTGSGKVTVANPNGINDFLLDLSDRAIKIEPGIKLQDSGNYEYKQLEDFWIKDVRAEGKGAASRLTIELGNVWSRLESPFRDVFNFVGRTIYRDWKSGRSNQPFNYYFPSGEPEVNGNFLHLTGTAIWTGWKGWNPYFHVTITTNPFTLYFRWVDKDNHLKVVVTGSAYTLYDVEDGVETQLFNKSVSTANRFGVRLVWNRIEFYISEVLDDTYTHSGLFPRVPKPGYVGFAVTDADIKRFEFQDLEYDFHSNDLIHQLLAMSEYHDVKVGRQGVRQYSLQWGPQTDIPDPATALRTILEAEKMELVWREAYIEVGRFTATDAVKTIEDRIIETDYVYDGNRRINLAQVDGNDDSWFEIDLGDAKQRDRMINAYFDLPELEEPDDVMERGIEEIRRSTSRESPGGLVPLFFDLWRMDPIVWVDNRGTVYNVRIEGIRVDINQSNTPYQRQELDTSLLASEE